MNAKFTTYNPDNRKPKNNEEDSLQARCFKHWNKYYRKVSLLFSVPNGQERNFFEASIAVATGLTSGVADLILLLRGPKTVFLELKALKGRQRKDQIIFEASVKKLGFEYHLIRTFEEFTDLLTALLGPTNEETNSKED
jgi:hypothetical protein